MQSNAKPIIHFPFSSPASARIFLYIEFVRADAERLRFGSPACDDFVTVKTMCKRCFIAAEMLAAAVLAAMGLTYRRAVLAAVYREMRVRAAFGAFHNVFTFLSRLCVVLCFLSARFRRRGGGRCTKSTLPARQTRSRGGRRFHR